MRVIKLRDGSAIFLEEDIDISRLLGSNKRFIKIGNMIINRADITAVVSKEQYDSMVRQASGLVLTSQGWLGRKEYERNSFLKICIPEELLVTKDYLKLKETKLKETKLKETKLKETKLKETKLKELKNE